MKTTSDNFITCRLTDITEALSADILKHNQDSKIVIHFSNDIICISTPHQWKTEV